MPSREVEIERARQRHYLPPEPARPRGRGRPRAELFDLGDSLVLARPRGLYEVDLLGFYVDARDPHDEEGNPITLLDVPEDERLYQLLTPRQRRRVERGLAETYDFRRAEAA